MEAFTIYIIICLYSPGNCIDYVGTHSCFFQSQVACTNFAGRMFDIKRRELKAKGEIYIDGISFCLKVAEAKEA